MLISYSQARASGNWKHLVKNGDASGPLSGWSKVTLMVTNFLPPEQPHRWYLLPPGCCQRPKPVPSVDCFMSFYHFLRCFQQVVKATQTSTRPVSFSQALYCLSISPQEAFLGRAQLIPKKDVKAQSQAHHQLQNLQPSVSQQNLEILEEVGWAEQLQDESTNWVKLHRQASGSAEESPSWGPATVKTSWKPKNLRNLF